MNGAGVPQGRSGGRLARSSFRYCSDGPKCVSLPCTKRLPVALHHTTSLQEERADYSR